jgi:hypothetical protein
VVIADVDDVAAMVAGPGADPQRGASRDWDFHGVYARPLPIYRTFRQIWLSTPVNCALRRSSCRSSWRRACQLPGVRERQLQHLARRREREARPDRILVRAPGYPRRCDRDCALAIQLHWDQGVQAEHARLEIAAMTAGSSGKQ